MAHRKGFSLLELLIALMLVALLAAIALPASSSLIERSRVRGAALDLANALALARNEAVHRAGRTVLTNDDGDWSHGWRLFVDTDGNGLQGANDVVLRHWFPPRGVRIVSNQATARYVSYIASGQARTPAGAFQAGSLCVNGGEGAGYRLVLARSGRVRMEAWPGPPAPCSGG